MNFTTFNINLCNNQNNEDNEYYEVDFSEISIQINKKQYDDKIDILISFPENLINEPINQKTIQEITQEIIPYVPKINCIQPIDDSFASVLPSNNDEYPDSKLQMFAMSYNILRIMSGMGGLSYSS